MKKLVFWIILAVFCLYNMANYMSRNKSTGDPFHEKVGSECGTVVSMFSESRAKHNYANDYYLEMRYPDRQTVVNVDGRVWHASSEGDYRTPPVPINLTLQKKQIEIIELNIKKIKNGNTK